MNRKNYHYNFDSKFQIPVQRLTLPFSCLFQQPNKYTVNWIFTDFISYQCTPTLYYSYFPITRLMLLINPHDSKILFVTALPLPTINLLHRKFADTFQEIKVQL